MPYAFANYRQTDIEYKLNIARFRPLDVLVTGATGAGKSTTLNALFQKTVARVGNGVGPETMELSPYSLNNVFRIWDTPGLGDGVRQDLSHQRKLAEMLDNTYSMEGKRFGFIDLALVIIDGSSRDLGTTYRLLCETIVPHIQPERILVVINQADLAMKGQHWQYALGKPDAELACFLEGQAESVQRRVLEATGLNIARPVNYSAEYGYGIKNVMDFIIDHIPVARRPV